MSSPVVVIGGGITGLAAAYDLVQQGRAVVLLESDTRLGGKIHAGPVTGAGLPFDVDMAADGFLARQPEVVNLCHELGLGDQLVAPSGAPAYIWFDGALRKIPAPSVLGVPFDVSSIEQSDLISPAGTADFAARIDKPAAPLVGDASVGEVLRPRVGDEVFERLIDPLLGGINAGEADRLSIGAGAAQLADAARVGGSLRAALRAQVDASRAADGGPVFNGLRGGTHKIVDSLGAVLGDRVYTGTPAERLEPTSGGWRVWAGGEPIDASRVILATPSWVTAGLIAPYVPESAAVLAGISYGDAVLVTFVIDTSKIANPLNGSGFLVPRSQGLLMTACSWSSSKWGHYDDGTHAILRVSAGRTDDLRWLDMSEADIVDTLCQELTTTIGLEGEPTARVTAWHQSLPQYRPGHFGRCDDIDAQLAAEAPGVTVTGAQMRGLGLPACVRQGRAAAQA
jgi:oxygen-dependent protoporphyrinogen oxidase